MYKSILVSLDGSRESEAVLPEVERLLKGGQCTVILLTTALEVDLEAAAQAIRPDVEYHAHELPREVFEVVRTSTERSALAYLEGIARRLEQCGAHVETVVSYNRPADAIRFYAAMYQADLIAMTIHGRTGLNRLRSGSVTEALLHSAPCPVLVTRVPEMAMPRFASDHMKLSADGRSL